MFFPGLADDTGVVPPSCKDGPCFFGFVVGVVTACRFLFDSILRRKLRSVEGHASSWSGIGGIDGRDETRPSRGGVWIGRILRASMQLDSESIPRSRQQQRSRCILSPEESHGASSSEGRLNTEHRTLVPYPPHLRMVTGTVCLVSS